MLLFFIVIKDHPINMVHDFKYLESYVGSKKCDVKIRIELAWVAFAKLMPISRLPKVKQNFKLCLLKAACQY